MDFDRNVLADRLKNTRINKGIKQKELSKKIGVSSAMLSAYESKTAVNGRNPSLGNIVAISKVLGVSVDWLCGLSDNKKPEINKEIDTETFLYSMMTFLNKTVVHRESKTILIPLNTELKSFIEDYINIKESILDNNLLPKGFDEEIIIRGIVEKYRHKSIEELTTPNEK